MATNGRRGHRKRGDFICYLPTRLLAEILLYGKDKTDWLGILNAYLLDNTGNPLAYSEEYGKKLYKFSQWKQIPVHAVHTHWWIGKFYGIKDEKQYVYSDLIKVSFNPMVGFTIQRLVILELELE